MIKYLSILYQSVLRLIYPAHCAVCSCALQGSEQGLCSHCALGLATTEYDLHLAEQRLWASPIFRNLYSLYTYQKGSPSQRLIYAYKYRGDWSIANLVAERARLMPGFDLARYDLILAVPLSPSRLRERGYNQALVLAQAFARQVGGLAYADNYILRREQETNQKDLNALERRLLSPDTFYLNPQYNIPWAEQRILLVDDVLTTGATLLSMLRLLERLGARDVDVFTISVAI